METDIDVAGPFLRLAARGEHGKDVTAVLADGLENRGQHTGLVGKHEGKLKAALARPAEVHQHSEDIMIGDDPYEFPGTIDHGQAADALVFHEQGGGVHGVGVIDRDRIAGHDVFHLHFGKEIIQLVHIERRRLGRRGGPDVPVGNDAYHMPPVKDGKTPDIMILHQLRRFQHGCVRGHGDDVLGHPLTNQHGNLLARQSESYKG